MEMKFVCTEPGDYKTPSKWLVTITGKNGKSQDFDYHCGCAHRILQKPKDGYFGQNLPKGFKWGERVPTNYFKSIFAVGIVNTYSVPILPHNIDDILYCLFSDSNLVRFGQGFEDFCSELGFNSDSIKDRKVYDGCLENWRKLASLGVDFEQLDEKFADF